jgi:cysteine-rich repeat protein
VVSGYSNCIGKAAMCTDPNLNTFDQCTEENPCAAGAVLAGSSTTMVKAGTTHVEASTDLYVGMKIQVYVRLKTGGGDVAEAMQIASAGAALEAGGKFPLKITGGGGGGAVCTFEVHTDNTVTKTACSALGAYTTVPTVSLYDHDDPEFIQLCADIGAACTGKVTANFDGNKYCSAANCAGYTAPTFTAVLDNTGDGVTAVGTKTIVNYVLDAGTTWEIHVDSAFGAAPDKDANFFRIFAEGISGFARNQRDGGTSTGTVAVPIDASTISCETRVLKTGTIEFYSSGNNKQNYVRLDSEASTFDTAYNGYKIRIRAKDGAWDSRSIKSYTGTVSGLVQADMVGSVAGVVTFKLKAETAQKVQSVASAAAGTPNVNAGTAEDVSLQLEESYETTTTIADFYKGVLIEVDIDGDPSTSDDIYVRKIAGFSAANTATPAYPDVSIKIPFIRKSLLSGRTGKAGDDAANLYLADSSDIGGSEGGRGLSDDNDFYNGMVLILDIDGYPETEDDIYVQTINDYVGATRKVTLAANAATATADSTWTIVQALTDFDLATTRSTFRIFSRGAILDAVITTGTDPANVENSEALGADANAGATTVTLGASASTTADDYRGFKLRITENGVTDAYTITDYAADKTATIYPPLLRKHTAAGATCIIHRTYEIYQDLGAECLRNVNMTVTYTYGTARSVSNDPGELSTIHSNWDQVLSRKTGWAARPEQRDVRSWTLKLAGEGYYNELYPGEGLASFDKNPLISAGTEAALLDTTAADVAAAAIELTLTGSRTNIQVGQHLLLTTISTAASRQYEVVKVVGLTTAKKISVLRGQMNTAAQVFAQNAVVSIKTTGFNTGQGMDEMAELGGTSRYSSAIDDAYTGLWVTIVEGTGVGQTRWISDYHGDSRTVYIGGSPWSIIPDTSSKYKIWYSAEIADYRSEGKIAVATYPRPVKKGYLVEFDWYGCATDVPASFLNNAWQDSTSAAGTLDQNYAPRQVRPGLPECKGQLGMRKPKQGPAVVYPRFKVLQTDYVSGVVLVKTSASHLTLDMHAETDPNLYVGRQIHVYSGANDRGTRTILQSWLGGTSQKRYTEVMLDSALDTNVAVNDIFTIYPAAGVSGKTTISEVGQNGDQYTVEEVDVVRYEYPELIEQHREWPHGYSYLQMKAGEDGEHVGNLFLKDYTQYSSDSYYTDSITIPQAVFESYVRGQPNGVSGEFPFTIKTPPGKSNIELLSIVIGYPVLKEADASSYDSTDIETKRVSSHGPPPFYPYSPGWSGVDESARTTRTHPRFQTHAYTSTCGNGVHDDGEYCDDGNEVDGDGCSSACSLEAGWACETVSLQSPSICRKGLVGSRYPDQEVGCKFYACEAPPVRGNSDNYGPEVTDANIVTWNTNFNLASADGGADGKNPAGQGMTIICSGTATDGVQTWYPGGLAARTAAAVNPYGPNYPICKLGGIQGTCTQCITWDTSSLTPSVDGDSSGVTGGLLGDSGVPGYDGSNKRRLLSDVDESAPAALSDVDESTSAAPVSVAQEGDEGQTVTL